MHRSSYVLLRQSLRACVPVLSRCRKECGTPLWVLEKTKKDHEADVKANDSKQEKTLKELQLLKVNIIFVQQSLLL